jgi:hypothetical protein
MTPEERARNIGWCTCPIGTGGDTIGGSHGEFCMVTQIAAAIRNAINDKLDEVAAEIEALERGTYTATKSAAEMVRAMKVT